MTALAFADNSSARVTHTRRPAIDNVQAGSVCLWLYPTNITANLRRFASKGQSETNGWILFRDTGSGSTMKFYLHRATTAQTVNTGTVLTANVWQWIVFTWSITNGAPKAYRGTLDAPAKAVTTSAVNGSGATVNDSARDLIVGRDTIDVDTCAPMRCAGMVYYDRVLSPDEIEALRMEPGIIPDCRLVYSRYGVNGLGTQPDLGGRNYSGVITSATLSDGPPGVVWDVEPYASFREAYQQAV